jgi:hypothetical protein
MEDRIVMNMRTFIESLEETHRAMSGWLREWVDEAARLIEAMHALLVREQIPVVPDYWGEMKRSHAKQVRADEQRAPHCAGRMQRYFLVHQLMM